MATRQRPDDWDEDGYLAANPDIKIGQNWNLSGWDHYDLYGAGEGRQAARRAQNNAQMNEGGSWEDYGQQFTGQSSGQSNGGQGQWDGNGTNVGGEGGQGDYGNTGTGGTNYAGGTNNAGTNGNGGNGGNGGSGQNREVPKNKASQGYQYLGKGYQAPQRGQTQGYGGQTAVAAPPPPPPLPSMAASPNFAALSAVGGAPDYMQMARMQAAPDYAKMAANLPQAQRAQGYKSTQDFNAIAGKLGDAQMGPQYQTDPKAFMGENMAPDLEAFARNWMGNYNPYNAETVQAQRTASDLALQKQEQDQGNNLDAWMAQRGVLGSSIERDGRVALDESLRRTKSANEADLLDTLARYEMQGRQAAGGYGLQVGDYLRGLGSDRRQEGQFQYGADRQRSRDYESDRQARTGFAMQGAGLQEDADRYEFGTDYQAGRDYLGDIYNRTQTEMQAGQFGDSAAFNRANLNLSAAGQADQSELARGGLRLNAAGMQSNADIARANYGLGAAQFGENAWFNRANLEGQNINRGIDLWDRNNRNAQWGSEFDQRNAAAEYGSEVDRNNFNQRGHQWQQDYDQRDFWNEQDMYRYLYGAA